MCPHSAFSLLLLSKALFSTFFTSVCPGLAGWLQKHIYMYSTLVNLIMCIFYFRFDRCPNMMYFVLETGHPCY